MCMCVWWSQPINISAKWMVLADIIFFTCVCVYVFVCGITHSYSKHSYDGPDTSCACQMIASQSRYSVDNLQLVPIHSVDLSGTTKIPLRRPWKSAGCSHPPSASTHKTARTGSHNARKQLSSSKMQESRFSSRNVQSARERPNLVAISASGRVTAAQGSATPESGSTLTNSCTDDDIDIRSVDFDGAVQVGACVYLWMCVCLSVCLCACVYLWMCVCVCRRSAAVSPVL